ncbi:MAG: tryptophan synthase subunit alpha [Glaciihabitans sp.]|nr:tryptophan synthase subunit alpha [Glaciihabitans sp.]
MSEFHHIPRGRASLEVLRAEALEELDTVVHERLLAGEDPWEFMDELPTIDELVVYLLRADAINANDGQLPSPTREFRVLRQIALEHPALTGTVWRMLGPRVPTRIRVNNPDLS